jgi:hypothetical protein
LLTAAVAAVVALVVAAFTALVIGDVWAKPDAAHNRPKATANALILFFIEIPSDG